MRVYISGPITGVSDYMEKFEAAEKELKEKGYLVRVGSNKKGTWKILK